ncbi:MAG: restriction endonuclease subunit S [Candidatus Woesearchaeota archaeon]
MPFEFYYETNFKETELGPLPEDWDLVKLGDVCKEYKEKVGNEDKKYEPVAVGEYGLRKREEIYYKKLTEKIDKYIKYPFSSICFGLGTKRMAVGINTFINSNFCVSPAYKVFLIDTKKFNIYFFNFLIKYQSSLWGANYLIQSVRQGKKVDIERLFKEFIPLPPLSEQKAIAEVLQTIQEAKEKTEAVIEATKKLKKSMMKHLFTYGNVPLSDVDKVKLKDTEIGLIPEHWQVVRFKELINQKSEYSVTKVKKENYLQFGKIPIIDQSQNYISGYWNNEEDAFVGELPVIIFGDHTRAFKYVDFKFVCGADGTKIIIPKKSMVSPLFFYYALTFKEIPSRGYNRHYSILKNLPIPLPPLPEQQAIAEILQEIDEKIQKEEAKKKALENLFKSMLNNLMSGKLRVKKIGDMDEL